MHKLNEVDRRTSELMQEFLAHQNEIKQNVEYQDCSRHDIFEGWMINKLAYLQLLLERISRR